YGPFNIRNIDGWLYVTYAKHQAPDNEDDQKGPGNGYVDVFNTKGELVKRFASRGALNSPWGIAPAPTGFSSVPGAILIGNFGDGLINVYTTDGKFAGSIKDKWGHDIKIDGLWAIEGNVRHADPQRLYFTAGPGDESRGLFGYMEKMVK